MQKTETTTVPRQEVETPSDGNCFFHALFGNNNNKEGTFIDENHIEHRKQLIDYTKKELAKIIDDHGFNGRHEQNIELLNGFRSKLDMKTGTEFLGYSKERKQDLKNQLNNAIDKKYGNDGAWIYANLFLRLASDCFGISIVMNAEDHRSFFIYNKLAPEPKVINFVNGNHFEQPTKDNYQSSQRPFLIYAATTDNYYLARSTLDEMTGCDPNKEDNIVSGMTPLICAIKHENNDFAYEFIETFGKKIEFTKKSFGVNALFLMLTKGLTNKTSDGNINLHRDSHNQVPRKGDPNKYSALNIAKKIKGTIEGRYFKELINQKCTLDNTALHIACARRDTETIKFLIDSGADIKSKNTSGLTPFDMLDMEYQDAYNLCELITGINTNKKTNTKEPKFVLDKTKYDAFKKEDIEGIKTKDNTDNKKQLGDFNNAVKNNIKNSDTQNKNNKIHPPPPPPLNKNSNKKPLQSNILQNTQRPNVPQSNIPIPQKTEPGPTQNQYEQNNQYNNLKQNSHKKEENFWNDTVFGIFLQFLMFVLTIGIVWLIFNACGVFDDKKPEQKPEQKVIDNNKVTKDDQNQDKTPSNQQQTDAVSQSANNWRNHSANNNSTGFSGDTPTSHIIR